MPRSTRILAVLAALALSAVGCSTSTTTTGASSSANSSSPSSSGSAGSEVSSSPAAKLTGSPIKIGLVVALEGTEQAMMQPVPGVASAWQSMVNNSGGIGGHPVDVITMDSKGDPATYLADLKTLVGTDKVAAIITSDDVSDVSGGPYLEKEGIPVIGGNGFDTTSWGVRPDFYSNATTIPGTLLGQAVVAKEVGAKAFGTVVCAEVAACLQAEALFKPAAQQLGLKWTGIVTAAASAPNYTAQCLSLIQSGTDFISLALQSSVAARLVPDCLQQNFHGTFGVNSNAFVGSVEDKMTGATIAGNLEAFPWWANAAPVQQFRDAMAKYEPSVDFRTANATEIWASLELFKKAIGTPAGDVTPQTVTAAYSKIKNETLGGLLPQPVTYTAGKPAPPVNCFWVYTYKVGAQNPQILTFGKSGNGASGDLQSSCVSSSS